DDIRHPSEVVVQEGREFFRVHLLRKAREAPDVGEEDREILLFPSDREFLRILHDRVDDRRRNVLRESASDEFLVLLLEDVLRDEREDEDEGDLEEEQGSVPVEVRGEEELLVDEVSAAHRAEK